MKKQSAKENGGGYIKLRGEMLRSPAWAALSHAAKQIIERLIVEHIRHAGQLNGRLICTYTDFANFGIRYPSIAPAIRQCVQLGFVEITQRGWRAAVHGRPAQYRLTFLPTKTAPATDEWKHFRARHKHNSAKKTHRKNLGFRYENVPTSCRDENVPTSGDENVPT